MAKILNKTAAWRISIWTTLAFAVGTAIAFLAVYLLVAKGIRDRSDAWLSGEAEVLAQVAADTPRDHLYKRIVREVAELATRELPDERNSQGQKLNSVFFLIEDPNSNDNPLWVGPNSDEAFLKAIHKANIVPGTPQSLTVEGWPTPFRLVARRESNRTIYLGLSSRGTNHLLRSISRRFLLLWAGTVLVGFVISYMSAYRTLFRVEQITETVERIGSNDLGKRLPEATSVDEISRLAKTFNRMLDRIQSSVTELRLVIDAVAHDVKSPLTSIRGTLESALSRETSEQWRDSICEAIESLDRLLSLLNTALDVAEAQGGALRLCRVTVDFSETVRKLANLYEPTMLESEHQLITDIEDDVLVNADISLLHRVLNNLFENELAHLPPGCDIWIRLRSQGMSAELIVEDNGPGFPPDVIGRAFERFVKGKSSPGHGLGLALVSAVVRAHGGSVTISNRQEGGAVVTILMPVVVHAESLLTTRS